MKAWRRVGRVVRGLLLVLAGLLGALLLLLVLGLFTPFGRELLRGGGVSIANVILPGRIEIERLERLDLSGIGAKGIVVLDPTGVEVARVAQLEADWALGEILAGRYVIRNVQLSDARVDLRHVDEERRGLVFAFVDPEAPPSPPSDAPPPYVRVEHASVRRLDVQLPELPQLGQSTVRGLSLEGSYELEGTSAARLNQVTFEWERSGVILARLKKLQAEWERGSQASTLKLEAEVLQARLELEASLVLPPEASWTEQALTARLDVRGLEAQTLATLLRDPGLATAFSGELGLVARASGTPHQLRLELELRTAGGTVEAGVRATDFDALELNLVTSGLILRELRADLPAEPLGLRLGAQAKVGNPESMPISLRLSDASWGPHAMPELNVRALLEASRVSELELKLQDGKSHVELTGEVGFSGAAALRLQADVQAPTLQKLVELGGLSTQVAGRIQTKLQLTRSEAEALQVRGQASLRQFVWDEERIESAELSIDLAGVPPALGGAIRVQLEGARLGGQRFDDVSLELLGGPSRYQVGLSARGPDFGLHADFSMNRGATRIDLEGRAQGTSRGLPFELKLQPSRVDLRQSAFSTEGVTLSLAGQSVLVKGEASAERLALAIDSNGDLDLGELSRLLHLTEPLSGKVHLSGQVTGSPRVPVVALETRLAGFSWGARPALDGEFHVELDAGRGSSAFVGSLRSSSAAPSAATPSAATPSEASPSEALGHIELQANLRHTFQGGARWQESLLQGRPEGSLTLDKLDFSWIEAWLGEPLPVTGQVQAELVVGGTLEVPAVRLDLASRFQLRGDSRALSLLLDARLEEDEVQIQASLDDPQGHWLELAATAELPSEAHAGEPVTERLAALPSRGRWQIQGQLEERLLSSLPFLSREQGLPPATVSARTRIEHAPLQEPVGEFSLSLGQSAAHEFFGACQGGKLRIDVEAVLREGRLVVELLGHEGAKSLFSSRAQAEVRLAPALEGSAAALGPLTAAFEAKQLRLESLPFICERAQGELTAKVKLDDPLGATPRFDLALDVLGFSLAQARAGGNKNVVDLHLAGRADRSRGSVELAIEAGADRSTVRASVPILWQEGVVQIAEDAKMDARIRLTRLPIAPFLDPRGAISYATGTVSGRVDAGGTRAEPRLTGLLELERVAFTATDLAQPLRDVKGRLRFSEREASIEGFEAHDKDGSIALDGRLFFEKLEQVRAELRVVASRFPLRQQGQVVATADVDASVKTEVKPDKTNVAISLASADIWIENADFRSGIALDAHPDFVVDAALRPRPDSPEGPEQPEGGPAPSGEARAAQPLRTTSLDLSTRERFWIKRDDFAVNLSMKLQTEISGEQAIVKGDVLIERGYLALLGKTFDLERGSKLTFIGGPTPDPVIDLTAKYDNRRTGDQVKVHITGRGSAPVIAFFVNERRSEAGEAFSAIYGSQGTNQSSGGASAQAAGFVGGLTAGLLATSARRELGAAAPIIMIEPGERTGEGRVRAGFELDSLVPRFLRDFITGVYVEGIVAKESQNQGTSASTSGSGVRYGILLEFYYPKNFFSTAQYGPGATWSLDLGWQL